MGINYSLTKLVLIIWKCKYLQESNLNHSKILLISQFMPRTSQDIPPQCKTKMATNASEFQTNANACKTKSRKCEVDQHSPPKIQRR